MWEAPGAGEHAAWHDEAENWGTESQYALDSAAEGWQQRSAMSSLVSAVALLG